MNTIIVEVGAIINPNGKRIEFSDVVAGLKNQILVFLNTKVNEGKLWDALKSDAGSKFVEALGLRVIFKDGSDNENEDDTVKIEVVVKDENDDVELLGSPEPDDEDIQKFNSQGNFAYVWQ